jgi:FkbM family methyltransferase
MAGSVVIYGFGNAGRSVARHLLSIGQEIEAFLDVAAARASNTTYEGVPLFTPAQWLDSHQAEQHDVLICVHNPFSPIVPIIDQMRASGFRQVLTMVDYVNIWPADNEFRYWLTPKDFYADKKEAIAAAAGLLRDAVSSRWMEATLGLRLFGDYRSMPKPSFSDQYMPADLRRWPEPLSLLDCGACDGDTIAAMLAAGYQVDRIVAFEPDLTNYNKLRARFAATGGTFLPCVVSDSTGTVQFGAGHGPASRVTDHDGVTLQSLTIDEACQGFNPTLVKMDIEGSEQAALRGAVETLRRVRPGLAISIYHNPDDLWNIPLFIARLDLNYTMFIRGHGHSGFDLVLYCVPM